MNYTKIHLFWRSSNELCNGKLIKSKCIILFIKMIYIIQSLCVMNRIIIYFDTRLDLFMMLGMISLSRKRKISTYSFINFKFSQVLFCLITTK